MIDKAPPFLPDDALTSERFRPVLDALIADWSKTWLAQGRAAPRPAFQDDWPSSATKSRWRSVEDLAAIELGSSAGLAVAGAMLGTHVPSTTLQGADRIIVERLATAAADDLLRRIGRLARGHGTDLRLSSEAIGFDSCLWWTIALGTGKRLFKLALSRAAMIAILKRQLPEAKRPRITPTGQAIAGQDIKVSVSIGSSSVSFAELQDLAIGDVLVLDRLATGKLELLVNGRPSALRASLEAKDGEAALVLV